MHCLLQAPLLMLEISTFHSNFFFGPLLQPNSRSTFPLVLTGFVRVGQTPIHKAAFMGHAGNIRCLLAASADKNARTK